MLLPLLLLLAFQQASPGLPNTKQYARKQPSLHAPCSFLPLAFQRFTVYYWLDSLLPMRVPAGPVLAVLAEPAPWPACLAACFLIAAAAIGAAAWRARSMEVAYGATD